MQIRLSLNSDLKPVLITGYKHPQNLKTSKPWIHTKSMRSPLSEETGNHTGPLFWWYCGNRIWWAEGSMNPRCHKTYAWKKNLKKVQSPATLVKFLRSSCLWHVEMPFLKWNKLVDTYCNKTETILCGRMGLFGIWGNVKHISTLTQQAFVWSEARECSAGVPSGNASSPFTW